MRRVTRVASNSIMFIRHAEKPDKDHKGVTPDGDHDEHSLSVRGWTRAGALAVVFARTSNGSDSYSGIAIPDRIIATAPSESYKSKREHDTALPTAHRLGLTIEATAIPDHYSAVAANIQATATPTLVVWHHGRIPEFIASFPVANANEVPKAWPEDRFDLIWALTPEGDHYVWSEIPQALLEGDETN